MPLSAFLPIELHDGGYKLLVNFTPTANFASVSDFETGVVIEKMGDIKIGIENAGDIESLGFLYIPASVEISFRCNTYENEFFDVMKGLGRIELWKGSYGTGVKIFVGDLVSTSIEFVQTQTSTGRVFSASFKWLGNDDLLDAPLRSQNNYVKNTSDFDLMFGLGASSEIFLRLSYIIKRVVDFGYNVASTDIMFRDFYIAYRIARAYTASGAYTDHLALATPIFERLDILCAFFWGTSIREADNDSVVNGAYNTFRELFLALLEWFGIVVYILPDVTCIVEPLQAIYITDETLPDANILSFAKRYIASEKKNGMVYFGEHRYVTGSGTYGKEFRSLSTPALERGSVRRFGSAHMACTTFDLYDEDNYGLASNVEMKKMPFHVVEPPELLSVLSFSSTASFKDNGTMFALGASGDENDMNSPSLGACALNEAIADPEKSFTWQCLERDWVFDQLDKDIFEMVLDGVGWDITKTYQLQVDSTIDASQLKLRPRYIEYDYNKGQARVQFVCVS